MIADGGEDLPLRINDVVVLLGHRWGARPSRANFRTGAMTVCTMVPMRLDPAPGRRCPRSRRRCLPPLACRRRRRRSGPSAARRPARPAERGPAAAPRRAHVRLRPLRRDLLRARRAHRRHGGRRPSRSRSSSRRPNRTGHAPATSANADGARPRSSPAGLRRAQLRTAAAGPWRLLRPRRARRRGGAARAPGAAGTTTRPLLVPEPLPERPVTAVTLDDLTRFYENPAREFARQRLGVGVPARGRRAHRPHPDRPRRARDVADRRPGPPSGPRRR